MVGVGGSNPLVPTKFYKSPCPFVFRTCCLISVRLHLFAFGDWHLVPLSFNYMEVHDIKRGGKGREQRANINQQIQADNVRLIDVEGEQLGIVTLQEALAKAVERQMDLVEISPGAEPPVCRLMDYGKHLFEQKQKAKDGRKKQRQTQVKEIKFRPGTDIGDYEVKLRNLIRFLEAGDKAKITVRFRGREMAHQELGLELLKRIEKDLEEYGSVEQRPNMEGRQMIMVLGPGRKKK